MSYTLTPQEFRNAKAALTRAKNSGDPRKVIAAVKAARELFEVKGFPDDWPMWRIAVDDLTFFSHDNQDAGVVAAARIETDKWI